MLPCWAGPEPSTLLSLLCVVCPQNLSSTCHTEQKSPSRSNFRDELERTPVLVRTWFQPQGHTHTVITVFLSLSHLFLWTSSSRTALLLSVTEFSVTSHPSTLWKYSMSPSRENYHLTGTSRYVVFRDSLGRAIIVQHPGLAPTLLPPTDFS